MIELLLSLLALCIFAAIAGVVRSRRLRSQLERGEIKEIPGIQRPRPEGCCGQHEVCEKDSLLAAVSRDIEYYDDEELDRFHGRDGSGYLPNEVEEFEDVLTTMRMEEVPGWIRSLQLRGINLPDQLKDDIILIVDELRQSSNLSNEHTNA